MTATKPQFDRKRHGSLYDRGGADSYYGRAAMPHWYPDGSFNGSRVTELNAAERAEYDAGYWAAEEAGDRKEW